MFDWLFWFHGLFVVIIMVGPSIVIVICYDMSVVPVCCFHFCSIMRCVSSAFTLSGLIFLALFDSKRCRNFRISDVTPHLEEIRITLWDNVPANNIASAQ